MRAIDALRLVGGGDAGTPAVTYLDSFDVSANITSLGGFEYLSGYFWIVDRTRNVVAKYSSVFGYVSEFDMSGQTTGAESITNDGTNLHVLHQSCGEATALYVYNTSGVLQSSITSWDATVSNAIVYNSPYYYVQIYSNSGIIHQYSSGNNTGTTWDLDMTNLYDITYIGGFYYVTGQNIYIKKYNSSFVLVDSIAHGLYSCSSITNDGSFLYANGKLTSTDDRLTIYKYDLF